MALCGLGWSPSAESTEIMYVSRNLLTRPIRPCPMRLTGKTSHSNKRQYKVVQCSSARKAVSPTESEENALSALSDSMEEELEHVTRFKISDFKILDHVSLGLGGRV